MDGNEPNQDDIPTRPLPTSSADSNSTDSNSTDSQPEDSTPTGTAPTEPLRTSGTGDTQPFAPYVPIANVLPGNTGQYAAVPLRSPRRHRALPWILGIIALVVAVGTITVLALLLNQRPVPAVTDSPSPSTSLTPSAPSQEPPSDESAAPSESPSAEPTPEPTVPTPEPTVPVPPAEPPAP